MKIETETCRQRECPGAPLRRKNTSGQAMVELTIALVAILVVVAGLLQLVSLALADITTLTESRRIAAQRAMLQAPTLATPPYIRDWDSGPDGRPYTRDDVPVTSMQYLLQHEITQNAAVTEQGWLFLEQAPSDALYDLHTALIPSAQFGLVHGAHTETVSLWPVVRSLLYDANEIELRTDTWMCWLRGLY